MPWLFAAVAVGLWWIWSQTVTAARTGVFDVQRHDELAVLPPSTSAIGDLAQAIAVAEGFGVAGAVPTRANNPGDLVLPHLGLPSANAAGVTMFTTPDEGWRALYRQLNLIADRQSHVYAPEMTIRAMADRWTGGDAPDAWTAAVVDVLTMRGYAVTADTPLTEVLG